MGADLNTINFRDAFHQTSLEVLTQRQWHRRGKQLALQTMGMSTKFWSQNWKERDQFEI